MCRSGSNMHVAMRWSVCACKILIRSASDLVYCASVCSSAGIRPLNVVWLRAVASAVQCAYNSHVTKIGQTPQRNLQCNQGRIQMSLMLLLLRLQVEMFRMVMMMMMQMQMQPVPAGPQL